MGDMGWRQLGACTEYDPALWHPEGTSRTQRPDWRTPRTICDTECEVRDKCQVWALDPSDPTEGHGMAGGLDPHQRRQLRKASA